MATRKIRPLNLADTVIHYAKIKAQTAKTYKQKLVHLLRRIENAKAELVDRNVDFYYIDEAIQDTKQLIASVDKIF